MEEMGLLLVGIVREGSWEVIFVSFLMCGWMDGWVCSEFGKLTWIDGWELRELDLIVVVGIVNAC